MKPLEEKMSEVLYPQYECDDNEAVRIMLMTLLHLHTEEDAILDCSGINHTRMVHHDGVYNNIVKLIKENKELALTSPNSYIRKFAEIILK